MSIEKKIENIIRENTSHIVNAQWLEVQAKAIAELVREEQIKFAEWLAEQDNDEDDSSKLTLIDNNWYYDDDTDGDQPLSEKELLTQYENRKP